MKHQGAAGHSITASARACSVSGTACSNYEKYVNDFYKFPVLCRKIHEALLQRPMAEWEIDRVFGRNQRYGNEVERGMRQLKKERRIQWTRWRKGDRGPHAEGWGIADDVVPNKCQGSMMDGWCGCVAVWRNYCKDYGGRGRGYMGLGQSMQRKWHSHFPYPSPLMENSGIWWSSSENYTPRDQIHAITSPNRPRTGEY